MKYMLLLILLNPDGSMNHIPSVSEDALFATQEGCETRRLHQAITYYTSPEFIPQWLCVPIWAYEV